jgi:hypothetical protein
VLLLATGLGGSSGSTPPVQTFNTDLNSCLESHIPSFQRIELPPAQISHNSYTVLFSGDLQNAAVFDACWGELGPVYDGTSGGPGG